MSRAHDQNDSQGKRQLTRRDLLRQGVQAGAGMAAALGFFTRQSRAAPTLPGPSGRPPGLTAGEGDDLLVRMQGELQRAMSKPRDARKWGMVIDTRKCVGCHACTVGCIAENKLPPGVIYRPVPITEKGRFPSVTIQFTPRPCMHCENPPCVPVCPVDATWKSLEQVVVIDYDVCIGCGLCVPACPYGARSLDSGANYTNETPVVQPYELRPNYEYGKQWSRADGEPPVRKARKCHFCLHRVERGMLPMCVTTCIGRATLFGDLNDGDGLVARLAAQPNRMILLEEKGTRPQVTYLV